MPKAIFIALAIALSGCAGSHQAGVAADSTITAIYSPLVRLGGAGSMMFLSTPRRAPEALALGDASRPLPATQQIEAPPQYDCFVPGPWIVFFKMDRLELSDEAKASLVYLLEKERDTCGKFNLTIEGHTHTRERRALSRQRAEAVRRYLQGQQIGVSINVKDMGSRVPRVPNTSTEAAIHNPRVEIHAQ